MYISVVPLVRTIRGVDAFTYTTAEPLQVGQIVRIPWRSQQVLGVVQAKTASALAKAKPISAVVPLKLPEAYHEYLQWFAQFYRISLPAAYHAALPELTKFLKPVQLKPLVSITPLRLSKTRVPVLTQLVTGLKRPTKPVTVLYQKETEAVVAVKGICEPNKVVVVLVAEELQAEWWAKQLRGYCITTHSQRTVRFAFQQLLQRQPGVYVGTKRLSLLPITEADVVIVINPELSSHKQWDQNPRYHTLRVAQVAARRLIFFSEAPRLEQYMSNVIRKELLPPMLATKLLQVALEPTQPIATSLIERLRDSRCAVVWHNRKGLNRYLQCTQCSHVMPNGSANCSKCGNAELRQKGFGTTYLLRQLEQALPSHKIIEVTADQAEPLLNHAEPTVYVGTTALFNRISWPQVELAIVTSLDAQLAIPDFRAHEHALQQLVYLRNRVPLLAIQTGVAEHSLIHAVQKPWPVQWYAKALAERKQFGYPPSGEYILCINRKTRQERVVRQLDAVPNHPDWMIDRER